MPASPPGPTLPALVVLGHLVTLIIFWRLRKHKREGKRAAGCRISFCGDLKSNESNINFFFFFCTFIILFISQMIYTGHVTNSPGSHTASRVACLHIVACLPCALVTFMCNLETIANCDRSKVLPVPFSQSVCSYLQLQRD